MSCEFLMNFDEPVLYVTRHFTFSRAPLVWRCGECGDVMSVSVVLWAYISNLEAWLFVQASDSVDSGRAWSMDAHAKMWCFCMQFTCDFQEVYLSNYNVWISRSFCLILLHKSWILKPRIPSRTLAILLSNPCDIQITNHNGLFTSK